VATVPALVVTDVVRGADTWVFDWMLTEPRLALLSMVTTVESSLSGPPSGPKESAGGCRRLCWDCAEKS
jgi:hypothetical protein